MKNKNIFIALCSVALLSFTACSEDTFDDINKDNQHPAPESVPAYLQLTEAIMNTGYSAVSGDYSFYVSSLTEQEIGAGNNQLMKAELRNPIEWAGSTTFNNAWNSIYGNLNNILQMQEKIENEVSGNVGHYDILAMAQILEALNFGILTDMHGDIPYSEACKGLENLQPKLDAQKDVYAGILATLDEAIANLDKAKAEELENAGNQDILFKGNLDQWKGLAYGLKARYLLHKLAIEPAVLADVKAAAQKAVELGFKGALINEFNGSTAFNPWTAYFISRYYTLSSTTVADMMKANKDPRLSFYTYDLDAYKPGDQFAAQISTPYDKDYNVVCSYPMWLDLGSQPIHVFSISELYFILAEAQLRTGEDATEAFQTAVKNSVVEVYGFFGEDGNAAADEYVATLGTPTLQTLFEQKYLAQCVDEQVETYNDLRRLEAMGESYINLTNPNNTQSGVNRFPYRLPYANSSVLANPSIKEAYGDGYYIYSEKVWWAGGTR